MICSDKLNQNSIAILIQALKGSKLISASSKGWQLPHGQPSMDFRRFCPFVLPFALLTPRHNHFLGFPGHRPQDLSFLDCKVTWCLMKPGTKLSLSSNVFAKSSPNSVTAGIFSVHNAISGHLPQSQQRPGKCNDCANNWLMEVRDKL